MTNIIKFEIATPERVVLKEDVLQVTVPTKNGEITVLPNHIPLVSSLRAGVIEIKRADGSIEIMATSGGFIEVLRDKVVVLADTAERADELDESRLVEAKKRAEKIKEDATHFDREAFAEINAQIAKEMARGHALTRWRKIKSINSTNNQ